MTAIAGDLNSAGSTPVSKNISKDVMDKLTRIVIKKAYALTATDIENIAKGFANCTSQLMINSNNPCLINKNYSGTLTGTLSLFEFYYVNGPTLPKFRRSEWHTKFTIKGKITTSYYIQSIVNGKVICAKKTDVKIVDKFPSRNGSEDGRSRSEYKNPLPGYENIPLAWNEGFYDELTKVIPFGNFNLSINQTVENPRYDYKKCCNSTSPSPAP